MASPVALVGAGPGDPGLLTLKGARAIKQCDTLVYDHLASQAIVDLAPRLEDAGEIFYEGSAFESSSLRFYLEKNISFVTNAETELSALEKMSADHPVFLIIHKERVPYWQDRLTERFHIFHQETTCGPHVVVANDIQLKN